MISLKEHNDIVEQLLKEIGNKENEIKSMNKQIQKGQPNQTPQIEPTQNEVQLNRKIAQISKEYKERVNTLSQQLRSKSIQIKDLKQRLVLKKNQQIKDKDHVAEMMKKNYDRKPSTPHDHKVAALISHYESELQKKAQFIQNLQKQIRLNSIKLSLPRNQENQEDDDDQNSNLLAQSCEESKKQGISILQHQNQIQKIKNQTQKYQRLFEEKDKEYKDLAKRYGQLTNEYYKILNTYGCQEPKTLTHSLSNKAIAQNDKFAKNKKTPASKQSALQNLLHEMAVDESQAESSQLSYSFQVKQNRLNAKKNGYQFEDDQNNFSQDETQKQNDKLIEIMEILNLNEISQIIPHLLKKQAQNQDLTLNDNICRFIQSFLYRFGMGKLPKTEIISAMQELEIKLNKHIQNSDLLDEICIQIGAKKQKIKDKIQELKSTQDQYLKNMKNLKFVQQLPKSNKVIQFIQYFQLDQNDLELPQQLKDIYQQLKYIQKFIKHANTILEYQPSKGIQPSLENILKFLQKATTFLINSESSSKNSKLIKK